MFANIHNLKLTVMIVAKSFQIYYVQKIKHFSIKMISNTQWGSSKTYQIKNLLNITPTKYIEPTKCKTYQI